MARSGGTDVRTGESWSRIPPSTPALQDGSDALREGEWDRARSAFRVEIADSPGRAEAWEGLGTACYWLQRSDELLGARREAYRLYCARRDYRSAARLAALLAGALLEFRAESAVAGAWIERALQLVEGLEPSVQRTFVKAMQTHFALMVWNDPAAALSAAGEAREIAHGVGATDTEILARASEALALVATGGIADGLHRLDAAAVAALGGEMADPHAMSITCCYLIEGCDRVRDLPRADEWCRRFRELCARRGLGKFLSFCRVQYATLLIWQGRWAEAEAELEAPVRMSSVHGPRPAPVCWYGWESCGGARVAGRRPTRSSGRRAATRAPRSTARTSRSSAATPRPPRTSPRRRSAGPAT